MRKFGLIGRGLSHSFSPQYFEKKFSQESIDAGYDLFDLDSIAEIDNLFDSTELHGLNVTIPYKQAVIPYLDHLVGAALELQAVNTIVFDQGQKIGYNTDVIGFQKSLRPFLKHGQTRALILGTGGASTAVSYVLKNIGVDVFFLSRSPNNEREFSYDECNYNMIDSCTIIVNTTPCGTYPEINDAPKIPYEFITGEHLCYDLIYNPSKSMFLERSEQQGATIVNGLSMLKLQAEASWELWCDHQ